jgi:hypothetical protein
VLVSHRGCGAIVMIEDIHQWDQVPPLLPAVIVIIVMAVAV